MAGHDIVVLGFSAGGIDPLQHLIAGLPPDFPASIFVVHDFPSTSVSSLASILDRAGRLEAAVHAGGVDGVLPLGQIGSALRDLVACGAAA